MCLDAAESVRLNPHKPQYNRNSTRHRDKVGLLLPSSATSVFFLNLTFHRHFAPLWTDYTAIRTALHFFLISIIFFTFLVVIIFFLLIFFISSFFPITTCFGFSMFYICSFI